MRHRYISYFAGIFLLAFFAVLNTGVLISVSGFQRLQNPVVSQPDFRRQPVSETMQVYLKQAACENQAEIPPGFEVSEIH